MATCFYCKTEVPDELIGEKIEDINGDSHGLCIGCRRATDVGRPLLDLEPKLAEAFAELERLCREAGEALNSGKEGRG